MIVAENPKPRIEEFRELMSRIDTALNADAVRNPDYYTQRGGWSLESDVEAAAKECAKNTKFEGSIKLVSGSSFPDIVAAKYYGIEVKSTSKDHWHSIGSSILESTRIEDVERIYLTFGKLAKPVAFLSRPYEECLSGISVTHYPRYQIDMTLKQGETIFDKMGIPYDTLRNMDNPAAPVAAYYKKKLRPGESLWWVGDNLEQDVPATVRLWSALSATEKDSYEAQSYVFFPECIMSRGNRKYNRAVLWLATQCGIINSNVRDSFSAGGQCTLKNLSGLYTNMPAVFGKILNHIDEVEKVLYGTPKETLQEFWEGPVKTDRLMQWIELIVKNASNDHEKNNAKSVMLQMFKDRSKR